ncbi:MAG: hypothetical protein M1816_007039 [Peltula sp. TS41687]|nr:MAG: hypothetical protein M1816_007039 [Peltula sp. TS41687]
MSNGCTQTATATPQLSLRYVVGHLQSEQEKSMDSKLEHANAHLVAVRRIAYERTRYPDRTHGRRLLSERQRDMVNAELLFRFNVTHGVEDVGLEEYKEVDKITSATQTYLDAGETETKLNACVRRLARTDSALDASAAMLSSGTTSQ